MSTDRLTEVLNLYDVAGLSAVLASPHIPSDMKRDNFRVLKFLVEAAQKAEKPEVAVKAYYRMTKLKPDDSEVIINYANALRSVGKPDAAAQALEKLVLHNPADARLFNILGEIYSEMSDYSSAKVAFDRAIVLRPNFAEAYNNLGKLLKSQNKLEEAISSFALAVREKSDFFEGFVNLAAAHQKNNEFDAAITNYQRALELYPNSVSIIFNIGLAQEKLGLYFDALHTYDRVLQLKSDHDKALNNKGMILCREGRIQEGIDCLYSSLELSVEPARVICNIGVALADQGETGRAAEMLKKAIRVDPACAEAYWNLSLLTLRSGEFLDGFKLYEWRWKIGATVGMHIESTKPTWSGQKGARVFVWSEQGISDVLMFATILGELARLCTKVIFRCDRRLVALFERTFSGSIVIIGDDLGVNEKDFDYQIPIGSLPRFFRSNLESFKNGSSAFLLADPDRTQHLRRHLKRGEDRKLVGLSWRGGKNKNNKARLKDVPLEALAMAFNPEKYILVNIQYGDTTTECEKLKTATGIDLCNVEEIDNFQDLDGLAALISACDCVVTVDNLNAHLAGGLGLQTFVMLPFAAQWRWGRDADTSYWHEGLHLIRRKKIDLADDLLKSLKSEFE